MVMMVAAWSCDGVDKTPSHVYTVKVHIGDSVRRHHSVSLTMVNDTYSSLQDCGTQALAGGRAVFTGQTTGERVAFLRLDSLERPFYFVLEPGITSIDIDLHKWSISGSKGSARYAWLLNERQRLIDERTANREAYLKAIADTTLTLRKERAAVVRDSLLTDSLKRLMTKSTSGNDAVSRIMRERFGLH